MCIIKQALLNAYLQKRPMKHTLILEQGAVMGDRMKACGAHALLILGRHYMLSLQVNPNVLHSLTLEDSITQWYSHTYTNPFSASFSASQSLSALRSHTEHGVSTTHTPKKTQSHSLPKFDPVGDACAGNGTITSYRTMFDTAAANQAPYWNTSLPVSLGNNVISLSCVGKTIVDLRAAALTSLPHTYRFEFNLDGNNTIIDQSNASLLPRLRGNQTLALKGWFPNDANDLNTFNLTAYTGGECQTNKYVTEQHPLRNVTKAEVCIGDYFKAMWIDDLTTGYSFMGAQCTGSFLLKFSEDWDDRIGLVADPFIFLLDGISEKELLACIPYSTCTLNAVKFLTFNAVNNLKFLIRKLTAKGIGYWELFGNGSCTGIEWDADGDGVKEIFTPVIKK
jgi:hypothetical protein